MRCSLLRVPCWLLCFGKIICSVVSIKIRSTSVLTWCLQSFLVIISHFSLFLDICVSSMLETPIICNSSSSTLSIIDVLVMSYIGMVVIDEIIFLKYFVSYLPFRSSSFAVIHMKLIWSWYCDLQIILSSLSLVVIFFEVSANIEGCCRGAVCSIPIAYRCVMHVKGRDAYFVYF